ncbi:MAG TPA: histidine kinase dimerization/phospho-acceptor domain-containing protein [Gaiellaceae bacterium]|jgi:signal transduction histidine kinase
MLPTLTESEFRVARPLLGDELARIAHDLGTPLTAIGGYVDLIAEQPAGLSDEQLQFLAVIRRNAIRLDGLVRELQSICARCSLPE